MSSESSPATLARQLTDAGYLTPSWRDAFTQVDRKRFIPDRVWIRGEGGYHPINRTTDPDRWNALVYDDQALVTQVEDDDEAATARVPSSSASMPRVVALMLDALAVADGMTVLEVGTGTGYNAALLAARLGDRHVVSVEMDPRLADTARARLKDAGYAPTVITGDGSRAARPAHRTTASSPPTRFIRCRTPWSNRPRPAGRSCCRGERGSTTVSSFASP